MPASNQELAELFGIPPDEQFILDGGSDHVYNCRCQQCRRWWVLMGPNGGDPGDYGPFTRDEVVAEATAWGKPTEELI